MVLSGQRVRTGQLGRETPPRAAGGLGPGLRCRRGGRRLLAVLPGLGHVARVRVLRDGLAHPAVAVGGQEGPGPDQEAEAVVEGVALLRPVLREEAVAQRVVAHHVLDLQGPREGAFHPCPEAHGLVRSPGTPPTASAAPRALRGPGQRGARRLQGPFQPEVLRRGLRGAGQGRDVTGRSGAADGVTRRGPVTPFPLLSAPPPVSHPTCPWAPGREGVGTAAARVWCLTRARAGRRRAHGCTDHGAGRWVAGSPGDTAACAAAPRAPRLGDRARRAGAGAGRGHHPELRCSLPEWRPGPLGAREHEGLAPGWPGPSGSKRLSKALAAGIHRYWVPVTCLAAPRGGARWAWDPYQPRPLVLVASPRLSRPASPLRLGPGLRALRTVSCHKGGQKHGVGAAGTSSTARAGDCLSKELPEATLCAGLPKAQSSCHWDRPRSAISWRLVLLTIFLFSEVRHS